MDDREHAVKQMLGSLSKMRRHDRLLSGPFAGRTVFAADFDVQHSTLAALLDLRPAPEGWTVEQRGPVTLLLLDDELVATFVGNAGIHAPHVRNLLEANDEPDTHDCREDLPPALRAIPDVEVTWTKAGLVVRTITGPSGFQVVRDRDDLAVENPAAWRARAAVYLGLAQALEDGPPPPKPTGGYAVHDDEKPGPEDELDEETVRGMARETLGLPEVTVKRISPLNVEVRVDGELHSRPMVLPGTDPDLFRRSAAVQLALTEWAADHPQPDDERAAAVQELVAFAGDAGKVMEWDDAERLWAAGARIIDDTLVMRVETGQR